MESIYTKEFNGFIGRGLSPREAEIACAYAAAFFPLEESPRSQVADYGNLPGWDGQEEECYAALMGKRAKSVKSAA